MLHFVAAFFFLGSRFARGPFCVERVVVTHSVQLPNEGALFGQRDERQFVSDFRRDGGEVELCRKNFDDGNAVFLTYFSLDFVIQDAFFQLLLRRHVTSESLFLPESLFLLGCLSLVGSLLSHLKDDADSCRANPFASPSCARRSFPSGLRAREAYSSTTCETPRARRRRARTLAVEGILLTFRFFVCLTFLTLAAVARLVFMFGRSLNLLPKH